MALIILVGKSGTGKTTTIRHMRARYARSYTTRPPRENDDKISITPEEFERLKDEMVEYKEYCGHMYGRPKSEVLAARREDVVVDVEPKGVPAYTELCEREGIPYLIVLLKCPEHVRKKRAGKRAERDDSYFDSFEGQLEIDTSVFSPDNVARIIEAAVKALKTGDAQCLRI